MLFNSLQYLIFFPCVAALYFFMPKFRDSRIYLLLIASYAFYMAYRPIYTILILISTLIDYIASISIEKTESKKLRRIYLCMSLLCNLGFLFIFKYYNFFAQTVSGIINMPTFDILLPVGISFYTFQTLSYTIDVYMGKIRAERNFPVFALYVSFFPQLVAGPIERSGVLLPQLRNANSHKLEYERLTGGLKLMLIGFFKKVVVADRLAVMVNAVYNNPYDWQGVPIILATVFFAFQIYCDFSGYSDIAIGTARILGIDLTKNFDRPYLSRSVGEFWRKWHITLSRWFRDYVYIPLGGNRCSMPRVYLNLFITFLLSGLWHGANWTFVVWGGLNGIAVIFESFAVTALGHQSVRRRTLFNAGATIIGRIYTFIFICFTWIFFRAQSITHAVYLIKNILKDINNFNWNEFTSSFKIMGLSKAEFYTALYTLAFLIIMELTGYNAKIISRLPSAVRTLCYGVFTGAVIWLMWTGSQQFIYFAF